MKEKIAKIKSDPKRMCIVCRELKSKNELIRVVLFEEKLSLDVTGKMNGRGAYLCNNNQCMSLAKKQRSLSKAFKRKIDDGIYAELEAYGKD